MNLRFNRLGARVLLVTPGVVWAVAIAFAAGGRPVSAALAGTLAPASRAVAQAPAAQVPAAQAPAAQASGFVGDDTCTACHESEGKSLRASLHGKAQNVRTPSAKANQACETCHGPGREHAETGDKTKIRRFTAMAPRDASDTCVSCHDRGSHDRPHFP
jgi:hypothetical protein